MAVNEYVALLNHLILRGYWVKQKALAIDLAHYQSIQSFVLFWSFVPTDNINHVQVIKSSQGQALMGTESNHDFNYFDYTTAERHFSISQKMVSSLLCDSLEKFSLTKSATKQNLS